MALKNAMLEAQKLFTVRTPDEVDLSALTLRVGREVPQAIARGSAVVRRSLVQIASLVPCVLDVIRKSSCHELTVDQAQKIGHVLPGRDDEIGMPTTNLVAESTIEAFELSIEPHV